MEASRRTFHRRSPCSSKTNLRKYRCATRGAGLHRRRLQRRLVHRPGGDWAHLVEGGSHTQQRGRQLDHRRSEEHTSELQSRGHLVCRLLLEKKKKQILQKTDQARKKTQSNTRQQ